MESVTYEFLLAGDEVLEEVDGHGIITWEVSLAIYGQKLVDLPLGLELGRECGGRHLRFWIGDIEDIILHWY